MVAKDKFLREEILIPAVSKKFTFIRFSLPLYHISSHFSLMSLSSRQAEAAKKVKEEAEAAKKVKEEMMMKKNIKKMEKKKMMKKKEEMIVIVDSPENIVWRYIVLPISCFFKILYKYRYRIFFENITQYYIMKYWSILDFHGPVKA